jgi:hypothetical protein
LNKIKWILRATTVCCLLVPLLLVVVIYKDNLAGLVIPPQMQNLANSATSLKGQGNNGIDINSTLAQLGIDPSKIQQPQIQSLTYDNQTGVAVLAVGFVNPMNKSLDVSSFSVDVADTSGSHLFTIQLDKAIDIGGGQTGNISLSAEALNDQAKALMSSLISGNDTVNLNNLQLSNLNANVGGIVIHVDNPSQFLNNRSG